MNKGIVLKNAGFAKLRTSKKVVADLERRGKNVAAAGGSGMKVTTVIGSTRARVLVTTATPAARRREARNRALTKAFEAARL